MPKESPDILRGITLTIQEGEFIAVIGENGSGKTTLIKHLNALLIPAKGKIRIAGLDTRLPENLPEIRSKVGMVFQNPADQIVASTVEEDVAFGLENLNLPSAEIQQRVAEQLKTADLEELAKHPPHLLSGGQTQKLALAGVLVRQPNIILFDEPTSMLDPAARDAFLDRICRLHKAGKTIIYVTHHMEETVFADRIVVLKQGTIFLEGTPQEIFSEPQNLYEADLDIPIIIQLNKAFHGLGWDLPAMILSSQELMDALPRFQGNQTSGNKGIPRQQEAEVIRLKDVHYTYLSGTPLARPALVGASLKVQNGHIHGIAGTNGSGKSTLLQHINGILRPASGQVMVKEMMVSDPETPLRRVITQVGMVFQNPETQFFEVFVGDEIAYGPKQFNLTGLAQRVRDAMALVGLDFTAYKDRRLDTLSGGEKRKVALASTLILNPKIILFDEPTAGMDPQARDDLLALFKKLNAQGKTLLIATHRLDELAQVTDEISFMQQGRIIKTGQTSEILMDTDSLSNARLVAPLPIRVSRALIEKGWPIAGQDTTTPERLVDALKEKSQ